MILTRIRWILRSGPSWGMSGHISISSWSIEVSLGNDISLFNDYLDKYQSEIIDWSERHALRRKSKGFSFNFYYRHKSALLQVCYLTRNTSKLISVKKKKEVEI